MEKKKAKLVGRRWLFALCVVVISMSVSGWAWLRPAQRYQPSDLDFGGLRLVTWNVGYFAPVANKNARDVDIKRIAGTLKSLRAQVIVLQELSSSEQADAIARKLGQGWKAHSVSTGHHGQVLSVLSNLSGGRKESKEAGGRSMIGVTLIGEDDREIFILGVHSPHPGRGKKKTVESIRGALAWIQERSEPIRIMAGDLNYNFDPEPAKNKYNPLFRALTALMTDSTASIGETYYANTRIDHIFHYPKKMKVVKEDSGMVDIATRFARVPGWRDHRPVVATYHAGAN